MIEIIIKQAYLIFMCPYPNKALMKMNELHKSYITILSPCIYNKILFDYTTFENMKLTSRYIVFVIYDDKSHYPSTYNVLGKQQSYVRRI